MPLDPFTLMMVGVLALMVVVMIRNSRKQKADRETLMSKIVVGADVMTTSGIYGKIVSLNDDENEAVIESMPGTKFRIHRQAIASVVEKVVEPSAPAAKKPSSK